MSDGEAAAEFAQRITGSGKYGALCAETAEDVYRWEMSYGGKPREIESRARKRLHRLWAGYLGEPVHRKALDALARADAGSLPQICRDTLETHQSSRERIPIMEVFYREVFGITGPPRILADLACALNPLALSWMGLPADSLYLAYDINRRTVELINSYFAIEGRGPTAEHRDILVRPLVRPVDQEADVVLLLKMYHCLEHRRRGAGWELVSQTPARWVVVSFPTRNLASRRVDIIGNYEPRIREEARDCGWSCERLEFTTEVVLLIGKGQ